jgi:hypothetical protein
MNRNHIRKLAKRVAALDQPSEALALGRPSECLADAQRREDEFRAVLQRVLAAVPEERRQRVRDTWEAYQLQRQSDPTTRMTSLSWWIHRNANPRGAWFPDPLPLALVDALLDHPDAQIFDGCVHCGLAVPSLRSTGSDLKGTYKPAVKLFEACPHCGGPIHLSGSWKCRRNLGAELLAGRDPCKTTSPADPESDPDGDGGPLPRR